MSNIEIALEIALAAHKDQTDKGGHAYILHPLRVMHNVESDEEKIVAILHDVVEDSDFTFENLESRGIPSKCIGALKLLTHAKDVPYMEYIEQIGTNRLASIVKLSDLNDNCNLSRLSGVTQKDKDRFTKYRIAIAYLDNILAKEA